MKILWVSNHTPFQVDFGGGQRSNLIYRILRTVAEVDVLLLAQKEVKGCSIEDLYGKPEGRMKVIPPTPRGKRFPWRLVRWAAPRFVDRVAYNIGRRSLDYTPDPAVYSVLKNMDREKKYDLFIGRHLKYSAQAGLLERRKVIVDIDDSEIEYYRLLVSDPNTSFIRKLVLQKRIRTLERLVPKILHNNPSLWVSKEEDRQLPGFKRARVLPNIPYALSLCKEPSPLPPNLGSKNILFVGMLSYVYNRQGIDWFLKKVWPRVHYIEDAAKFCIVGSRLNEQDRAAWSSIPGVNVYGFVDDLKEVYRDAAFAIVPVWSGGGTNIKILEALMYGRTCVVTEPAFRGYGTFFGRDDAIAVCKNADDFVHQCLQLLRNPSQCAAMGYRGHAALIRHFSFKRFQQIVMETVESVLKDC